MPVYDYRVEQLEKIQPHKCATSLPKIKITQACSPGAINQSPKRFHETNWLELDDAMATRLVKWLCNNYTIENF